MTTPTTAVKPHIVSREFDAPRDLVWKVNTDAEHAKNVETRVGDVLKSMDDHGIDIKSSGIVVHSGELWLQSTEGEVQEVNDDEEQNDESRLKHVERSRGRLESALRLIAGWSRGLVGASQGECNSDVNENASEKNQACWPENLRDAVKELRVVVKLILSQENLQIPEKVSENEADHKQAGHRHEYLSANRGGEHVNHHFYRRKRPFSSHKTAHFRNICARILSRFL